MRNESKHRSHLSPELKKQARNRNGTEEERFWRKVLKTDSCWEWIGSRCSRGYGNFWFRKRIRPAHVVSWIMHNGEIPEGMEVCHNCPGGDHVWCVNPTHLFLGTHQENALDASKKGMFQGRGGEKNWNAKLSESKVEEIRKLYASGEYTGVALAKIYGIQTCQANMIIRGQSWKSQTNGVNISRGICGERHYHHLLTTELVIEIRNRFRNGESVAEISRSMNRTYACIKKAAYGITWKHVKSVVDEPCPTQTNLGL